MELVVYGCGSISPILPDSNNALQSDSCARNDCTGKCWQIVTLKNRPKATA